jgi:hypothetical protein
MMTSDAVRAANARIIWRIVAARVPTRQAIGNVSICLMYSTYINTYQCPVQNVSSRLVSA